MFRKRRKLAERVVISLLSFSCSDSQEMYTKGTCIVVVLGKRLAVLTFLLSSPTSDL